MKTGDRVRALVELQSDDRAVGIDDGTPIVSVGAEGVIIGKSSEFLEEGQSLKQDDCWVVDWGEVKFDTAPEEMELV